MKFYVNYFNDDTDTIAETKEFRSRPLALQATQSAPYRSECVDAKSGQVMFTYKRPQPAASYVYAYGDVACVFEPMDENDTPEDNVEYKLSEMTQGFRNLLANKGFNFNHDEKKITTTLDGLIYAIKTAYDVERLYNIWTDNKLIDNFEPEQKDRDLMTYYDLGGDDSYDYHGGYVLHICLPLYKQITGKEYAA